MFVVSLPGSAMSLSPSVFPVFKQLGIYDEFIRLSVPVKTATGYTADFNIIQQFEFDFVRERFGGYLQIIDRPALYELLVRLVPTGKILYGKKVLSIEQDDDRATICTSDGMKHHGDVIVGADGAYSAVRQALYKILSENNELPKEDDTSPPYNTTCVVGVTRPLAPEILDINDDECRCVSILYDNLPYMSLGFTAKGGRCEWMVCQYSDDYKTRDDEDRFRNSEWGPEASQTMCDAVRDLPSPFGKGQTLGSLIDNTDREGISKVMLEEKLYKTWHHGRTVLLGDACHKFFPAAGQGAVTAMLDAVALANVLEACPTNHVDDIKRCLDAYKEDQFPVAKQAYDTSVVVGALWKRVRITYRYLMAVNVSVEFT
ncbi:hypothetical protein DFQ27_003335 [Actinomortierella ambigua]|uniref:FAD-binding domain-containing protein n=1 Tax=Actinomortierella ambigua TaxID=1343610 RepID=A0A9P6Q8E8_9FUNG|nr:hypothetical protein DFQ27_003335 [Actinomortierella ambigua]